MILQLLWTVAVLTISTSSSHLVLGNPSGAGDVDFTNYLLTNHSLALSYNRDAGTANWVSWELRSYWLGDVERQDNFRPDARLPEGWYRVRPKDYQNSGFDRGHLVPSADRTRTESDNSATFEMTNVVPQHPGLNRGVWRSLEAHCRQLAEEKGQTLFVVAGVLGERGRIADGRVVVPGWLWKTWVSIHLTKEALLVDAVAVLIPNEEMPDDVGWEDYRLSVDDLEELTGYDFFDRLPDNVEMQIES